VSIVWLPVKKLGVTAAVQAGGSTFSTRWKGWTG